MDKPPGGKTILYLAIVGLAAFGPLAASAQAVDIGLAYAQNIGLPALDVRAIAVELIRCALGFAGFVMLLQILKGGFLMMTHGGVADLREEAIETIKGAVIGMIIIGISSSLANYIVTTIADAAGMAIGNYL